MNPLPIRWNFSISNVKVEIRCPSEWLMTKIEADVESSPVKFSFKVKIVRLVTEKVFPKGFRLSAKKYF